VKAVRKDVAYKHLSSIFRPDDQILSEQTAPKGIEVSLIAIALTDPGSLWQSPGFLFDMLVNRDVAPNFYPA
jgi:hypothetical protein